MASPRLWTTHQGDILFTFVMKGSFRLEGEGKDPYTLSPGDAFVIPPGMATRYADPALTSNFSKSRCPAIQPLNRARSSLRKYPRGEARHGPWGAESPPAPLAKG